MIRPVNLVYCSERLSSLLPAKHGAALFLVASDLKTCWIKLVRNNCVVRDQISMNLESVGTAHGFDLFDTVLYQSSAAQISVRVDRIFMEPKGEERAPEAFQRIMRLSLQKIFLESGHESYLGKAHVGHGSPDSDRAVFAIWKRHVVRKPRSSI